MLQNSQSWFGINKLIVNSMATYWAIITTEEANTARKLRLMKNSKGTRPKKLRAP